MAACTALVAASDQASTGLLQPQRSDTHSVSKLLRRSVKTGRASAGAWLLSEDHECHLQHSPQPHADSAAQHPPGTNPSLKLWSAAPDQLPATQGSQRVLALQLTPAVIAQGLPRVKLKLPNREQQNRESRSHNFSPLSIFCREALSHQDQR